MNRLAKKRWEFLGVICSRREAYRKCLYLMLIGTTETPWKLATKFAQI